MDKYQSKYDIAVIGGGPAGSTIAHQLTQFGYKVLLLEKAAFPRPHIGLSLSAGILHWLDLLEIRDIVAAKGFVSAKESKLLWASEHIVDKNFDTDKAGWHVDRGVFDEILMNAAVKKGVDLLQGFKQLQLQLSPEEQWDISIKDATNKTINIQADFLVEASGRKPVVKNSIKKAYLTKTLATYAYWRCNEVMCANSFIEAIPNGWVWGAPVSEYDYLMCVFSDADFIKKHASLNQFYNKSIECASLFPAQKYHRKDSILNTCDATAYVDSQPISKQYIRVGDAAYSLDPIASQGVQKAIKSAFQGAIVVNTLLSQPQNEMLAINYYKQVIDIEVTKNQTWTKAFYNQHQQFKHHSFWKTRQTFLTASEVENETVTLKKTAKLIVNKEASILSVPVLGATYVQEEEGIYLPTNLEPFVYVQNKAIVPLIRKLHDHYLIDCVKMIAAYMPNTAPVKVLEWLIYNKILCPKQ
ncbi:NAD(P)/FAD-dependent oxidoreductase [Aureispira sp. CCB-QB1]|uniref:flavin-dependent monooxygenase QhpG n=1 Tax=Aureispira sp. CCB-QB1 TaxID=1313421 RepID=UPI000697EB5B|nr:NAD(P)/FAD-dependent oxidoreductase [Aureispira sp. CCB-QB1]